MHCPVLLYFRQQGRVQDANHAQITFEGENSWIMQFQLLQNFSLRTFFHLGLLATWNIPLCTTTLLSPRYPPIQSHSEPSDTLVHAMRFIAWIQTRSTSTHHHQSCPASFPLFWDNHQLDFSIRIILLPNSIPYISHEHKTVSIPCCSCFLSYPTLRILTNKTHQPQTPGLPGASPTPQKPRAAPDAVPSPPGTHQKAVPTAVAVGELEL